MWKYRVFWKSENLNERKLLMYSDEELVKEGERIVQEFRPYSKLFVLKKNVK